MTETIKSVFEMFATDSGKETDGQWFRMGATEYLLARAGGSNVKFKAAYSSAMQPLQKQQALGALSDEEALHAIAPVFANHIILDWRTKTNGGYREHEIIGKNGEFVKFSKKAAQEHFIELPDVVRQAIIDQSTSWQNFASDALDAAGGN